jgi:HK97 family phage prohead protease
MKPIYKEFDEKATELPLFRLVTPKATVPGDVSGAVIDFRSSDETVDRYNEVIVAAGWKLDNYKKNPVVQNAHRYESVLDTIGKSIITEVRSSPDGPQHLFQRVEFAVAANPIAKITYDLYKGGFLAAVSVGFIPKRWENGSQEVGYRRKYIEQELLEVSAVGIPANPNALKLGFEAGAVDKSDLKELLKLLKDLCSDDAGIRTNASAPGPDANGAKLLQLLNATASLVR